MVAKTGAFAWDGTTYYVAYNVGLGSASTVVARYDAQGNAGAPITLAKVGPYGCYVVGMYVADGIIYALVERILPYTYYLELAEFDTSGALLGELELNVQDGPDNAILVTSPYGLAAVWFDRAVTERFYLAALSPSGDRLGSNVPIDLSVVAGVRIPFGYALLGSDRQPSLVRYDLRSGGIERVPVLPNDFPGADMDLTWTGRELVVSAAHMIGSDASIERRAFDWSNALVGSSSSDPSEQLTDPSLGWTGTTIEEARVVLDGMTTELTLAQLGSDTRELTPAMSVASAPGTNYGGVVYADASRIATSFVIPEPATNSWQVELHQRCP